MEGSNASSRWANPWLRKCPGHEDGSVLASGTAGAHEEYHVLTALQVRFHLGKIIFAVHRLFVDLKNHVAAAQIDVLGKRARFDVLHDHALARRHIQPLRHLGSKSADRDAELVLLGRALVVTALVIVQARRK